MAVDYSSPLGYWEPYKCEKCFKIFNDMVLQTYEDTEITFSHQENSATLAFIRSKDKQDFWSNILFKTQKVVYNVWIGAKYNINKFKEIDDSDISLKK